MRQVTALSVMALGLSTSAMAQTILYDPNAPQPQPGQIYPAPQPGFGQQPIYVDPNQPYSQPVPYRDFGQQPQPGFGQPLPQPQPNYGQSLPQPLPNYQPQPLPDFGQQQPQPGFGQTQPQPDFGQQAPAQNRPYYENALNDDEEPDEDVTVAPAPAAETVRSVKTERPLASAGRDRAPQMSAELAELVRLGQRYRAASPGFLDDLSALADKYRDPLPEPVADATSGTSGGDGTAQDEADTEVAMLDTAGQENSIDPSAEPALQPVTTVEPLSSDSISTTEYLSDDFTDGDFTLNPEWSVRQGNWKIDPVYGLRANAPEKTSTEPIRPKEILNVLLGGDAPSASDQSSQPKAALIEAPTTIANSFSLAARIVDHGGKGAAHFIMHQGGADWLGYRLELRSGPQPVVVLTRRGSTGYKDITKVTAPGFTQGETHELRWARLSDGQMFVILNGQPIITSRDTVFRGDWQGFAFFNAGGDVSIRTIRIAQPIER